MQVEKNDAKLIRELKKGNIPAFNSLFYKYSCRLYNFAFSYLKSKEDAEEIVQEVFTKIWNKRHDLNEDYNFKSYLFTVSYNQIKKHFRTKTQLNNYFNSIADSPKSDLQVLNDTNYFSLKTLVDQLVKTMPPRRKAVFMKSRYEGKNTKEISEELKISPSTVENHLNEALKFLRMHLKKENLAGILYLILFFQ